MNPPSIRLTDPEGSLLILKCVVPSRVNVTIGHQLDSPRDHRTMHLSEDQARQLRDFLQQLLKGQ